MDILFQNYKIQFSQTSLAHEEKQQNILPQQDLVQ